MSYHRHRRRSHGPSPAPSRRDDPGCSGKVRYDDVVEAFKYGRLSKGVLQSGEVLRAYECDHCERWHLTKEASIPTFLLPNEVHVTPTPNMLTIEFAIPSSFKPEDLAPALERARRIGAELFGHSDLRSHVSFPHRHEGGIEVARVSIHPAPVTTAIDAEE